MHRSSMFLIPLGFVIGVFSASLVTTGFYGGLLMVGLAAAAPVIVMSCLALVGLGWRRLHHGESVGRRADTLAWLTASVATVAIAVWLYGTTNVRPPSSKAHADVRALASAVSVYQRETGRLPEHLVDLTRPVAGTRGVEVGPFMSSVPSPPRGWLPYRYDRRPDGTFVVHTRGTDGEVRAP